MRQRDETPAEFLAMNEIHVGDVLEGAPIMHGAVVVERGFQMQVTAIGQESVIGRSRRIATDRWSKERMFHFSARDWKRSK